MSLSEIRVNTTKTRTGVGTITYTETGPVITGIATASNFKTGSTNVHSTGVELTNINTGGATATFGGAISGTSATLSGALSGTTASFSGTVSIGGTLTYEDVTNIDSVGVVTARSGILVSNDIRSSDDDFYVYSYKGGSSGQTRSGIQFDGTNQRLEFHTATDEVVRIDSSGHVNLMTSTQNAYIGFKANSNAINFTLGSTAGAEPRIYLFGSGNGQSNAKDISLLTGSNTGDISMSASKSTITSTVNEEIFRIQTSYGNSGANQGKALMGFDHFSVSDKPAILIGSEEEGTSSYKGAFVIKLKDAAATDDDPVERFRITSGGNIGINTATPTAQLSFLAKRSTQTMPPICFQSSAGAGLADAAISTTDDTGGTDIMMGSNVYMGQNGAFVRYMSGYGSAAVRCQYTGVTRFYNKSGDNAPVESMRITGNGRVNIGTGELDQTDRMLNVYGGRMRISGIAANSNSFEVYGNSTTGQSHGVLIDAGTNASDICAHFRQKGGSNLLQIRGDGNIRIGEGSRTVPKASLRGVDIDSGGYSACIGGNVNSSGRTDGTDKLSRITSPHRTNAEEPVALVAAYNQTGTNTIQYGGGSSITNAATHHHFYTAANTTTLNGTERLRIENDGDTYFWDHQGDSRMEIQKDGDFRVSNPGHATNTSPSTNSFQGLTQLGHAHWGQRQYYSGQVNLTQNGTFDLFSNNTAHDDIIFWLNVKGYHANRTFATVHGTIGGYGITYHSQHGASGGAFTFTASNIASGRNALRFTSTSSHGANWWVWGWYSGTAGTGTHTGRSAKQLH